jgi:tripartite-type tricarboxylate transporter receptor subunit TctC
MTFVKKTDTQAVIARRRQGRRGDLAAHEKGSDAPGLLRHTAPRNDTYRGRDALLAVIARRRQGRRGDLVAHEKGSDAPGLLRHLVPRNDTYRGRDALLAVIARRRQGRRGDLVAHEKGSDAPGLLRRAAPRNDILRFAASMFAVVLFAVTTTASAQTYPAKSIRIVVPWPPGGGTDVVARTVAQKFTEVLGQTVLVDNRAGANGIIGADAAAKAAPDGYTVMITIASQAINATLYPKLPYKNADLLPVSLLAEYPFVLTVHPSLPSKTPREFIALAKSRAGQLSYASSGSGSGPHLGMELLKNMSGIDMVHVPYKGAGQAMTDLISGNVQVFLNNFLAAAPHIKAGKLRALAVTSQKRSAAAPTLPTVSESAVPGYVVTGWYGMFVPAATSPAIVNTLHATAVKALRSKDVSDRLTNEAAEVVASTPQQFADYFKAEIAKWASVIRKAGIRTEG